MTPPVFIVAKVTVVVLSPLHTTWLTGWSTSPVGLTVTATSKVVPAQPLTLGVIRLCTTTGSVVVLMSVSVIVAPMPEPARLLIPVTAALVQANVAVLLVLVAVYVLDTLLHQLAVDELVITAIGFTITSTLKVVRLVQPFAVKV